MHLRFNADEDFSSERMALLLQVRRILWRNISGDNIFLELPWDFFLLTMTGFQPRVPEKKEKTMTGFSDAESGLDTTQQHFCTIFAPSLQKAFDYLIGSLQKFEIVEAICRPPRRVRAPWWPGYSDLTLFSRQVVYGCLSLRILPARRVKTFRQARLAKPRNSYQSIHHQFQKFFHELLVQNTY